MSEPRERDDLSPYAIGPLVGGLAGAAAEPPAEHNRTFRDVLRGAVKGTTVGAGAAGGVALARLLSADPGLLGYGAAAGGGGLVGYAAGSRLARLLGLGQPPVHDVQDFLERRAALERSAAALPGLLRARVESDRRNWAAKHAILRQLLAERPGEFVVDGRQGDLVGLTHSPSGFRIHMPVRALPGGFPVPE